MSCVISLREAVAALVRDGDTIALEGSAHLVPFAAAHELIRQGRRELTITRLAPDLVLDQLVGMGCARALIFAWGSRPNLARLPQLAAALEAGGSDALQVEQLRPTDMADAYEAGAMNLPFSVLRGYNRLTGVPQTRLIQPMTCPFSGQELAVVRAIRPDVAIIHAQEADRYGNVLLWGTVGMQKVAAMASRRLIVTVEEIVDDLRAWPNACRLPRAVVSAVCEVPGGAYPSPVTGYYERDHGFYQSWHSIARDRASFRNWMARHVLETADFDQFRRSLESAETTSFP